MTSSNVTITTPDAIGEITCAFAVLPALAKRVDVVVGQHGFSARVQALSAAYCGAVRRVSAPGFAWKTLAESKSVALHMRYITAEVYDAPNAMGCAVSRQTVATLCARKSADPAKGKVSDEEPATISPGTCRATPGAGRLSRPPGRAELGRARELVPEVSCSPAAGVAWRHCRRGHRRVRCSPRHHARPGPDGLLPARAEALGQSPPPKPLLPSSGSLDQLRLAEPAQAR